MNNEDLKRAIFVIFEVYISLYALSRWQAGLLLIGNFVKEENMMFSELVSSCILHELEKFWHLLPFYGIFIIGVLCVNVSCLDKKLKDHLIRRDEAEQLGEEGEVVR